MSNCQIIYCFTCKEPKTVDTKIWYIKQCIRCDIISNNYSICKYCKCHIKADTILCEKCSIRLKYHV